MPCQHYHQRVKTPSPKWTIKLRLSSLRIVITCYRRSKNRAVWTRTSVHWKNWSAKVGLHIKQVPTLLNPCWPFWDQIATEKGVVTKAHRIIIPATLQKYILANLHTPLKGTQRIKLRASTSTGKGCTMTWLPWPQKHAVPLSNSSKVDKRNW